MGARITQLTASNVKALRETHADAIASGNLTLTATTAEWQVGPQAALANLEGIMAQLPTRGHPRASLHAVARKLTASAAASTTDGKEQDMAKSATQGKKQGGKKQGGTTAAAPKKQAAKKPARKPLTKAEALAAMEKNKGAYDKYVKARQAGAKRGENPHAKGYKAYKQAYRDYLDATAGERAKKKKARETAAQARAAAAVAGEPVEGAEGTPDAADAAAVEA